MGCGASKEQFRFTLDGIPHILRDGPETAGGTHRRREFEVLNTYGDHVRAIWPDEDGRGWVSPL